jgi:hypothetical protein
LRETGVKQLEGEDIALKVNSFGVKVEIWGW